MNIQKFSKQSQEYLIKLLSSNSFDLNNKDDFLEIPDPYDLNGTKYQIYVFKKLTGYLPDSEKKDEPVLYTFYILKVDQNYKENYLKEVNKMRSGQMYDKNITSSYYSNFSPSFKPFDTLTYTLGKMLEEDLFQGKNYKFIFHLASVTKDYDIALVYLNQDSINQLEAMYPGEKEILFKI